MGIQRLMSIIPPKAKTLVEFSELAGKVILIDGSIYLYHFLAKPTRSNSHIYGYYQMMHRFLNNRITPIVLFDGKPPDEKKTTIEKRAKTKTIKVDQSMIDDIKKLLDHMGISHYQSNNESDFLAIKMFRDSQIYAILSDDTDFIFHMCPFVLRKFDFRSNKLELVNTSLVLELLGVTVSQFKVICLSAGSDYTVARSSIESAYKKIKSGDDCSADDYNAILESLEYYVDQSYDTEIIVSPYQYYRYDYEELSPWLKEKCNFKTDTLYRHFVNLMKFNFRLRIDITS